MPLSPTDLRKLRVEISDATPPTDADLHALYDELGSYQAVAADVLRKRLATILASPVDFSDEGTRLNFSKNVDALTEQLGALDSEVAVLTGEALSSGRLVRRRYLR